MTRNEVLAMKPGRELDALVAEKVMGLEYIPASSPSAGLIVQDHFFDPKTGDALFGWSPSTNIATAWEVWEHETPENWRMTVHKSNGRYLALIVEETKEKGHRTVAQVEAKTAAEAMVKCRLLAVMEG
jgi:hypothetical protein